jgi:REP element-mobilizing transposase RayT
MVFTLLRLGAVTKKAGISVWQKSFYDHVVRDEQDFQQIWKYIDENPMKWQQNCYFG